MTYSTVLIIGAGPAGLAVAGQLRQKGIAFEIIEQGDKPGYSWHHHYDRLHLHTVKELSNLPFLPFPDHFPRFVPRHLLADYFVEYARHFNIQPHYGESVTNVVKQNGKWLTTTSKGNSWESDHVVVATGVNRSPLEPHFKGQESFKGEWIHSRNYRNAKPFAGKQVLVIGMGNTGAEIALDLSENGAKPFISVRGPVNIVPREVLGRPTQLTALMLAKLPYWLGDRLGVVLRKLTVGNLRPYGIETPDMPPARQLRTTGKTPVIDVGTLKAIKEKRIGILPVIAQIEGAEVTFTDGRKMPFDTIILCTGYKPHLEQFIPGVSELLDAQDLPKSVIAPPPFEGLYFVGFDNYVAGGILGVIRRDSAVAAERIGRL